MAECRMRLIRRGRAQVRTKAVNNGTFCFKTFLDYSEYW